MLLYIKQKVILFINFYKLLGQAFYDAFFEDNVEGCFLLLTA
jgi:hypothetical protein